MQTKTTLTVHKPKITANIPCVYRFVLDNGYYYIGSTNSLHQRINKHLVKIRKGMCSIGIQGALKTATSISFEILKIDSVENIRIIEKETIISSIADDKCLNKLIDSIVTIGYSSNKVKVKQMDLNRNEVLIHESICAAAKHLNVSYSQIVQCTNGYSKSCKGFLFRRLDENGNEVIPYKKRRKQKRKPYIRKGRNPINKKSVNKYDSTGLLVATYDSISDASKSLLGGNYQTNKKAVTRILKGKIKRTKGYTFKYA